MLERADELERELAGCGQSGLSTWAVVVAAALQLESAALLV